ncbi:antibiotic biosynthesis monooxygenase [[Mycobacterium] nativiensis]|uniref:Antibiotic biosynthesis monooxygenase n=1 Tax=[Mycobacterium] nativiensis TaxID=2855503 RepID=A0ABU5XTE7_9MYCO|nr:antibiotic biosynthesis monooxygenase [Mycolicibacter sp. MYC340]MEB3031028.1 antibiotic biosynthesis monooxygenase [Mycolicibacter sp. MYC340]
MYARSTTITAQPSAIDAGITHIRDEVMPALRDIDGCIGLSLLVDRQSGRCIATSSWENAEAMRAGTERVQPIRDRAAAVFGGTGTAEEWDIAVLHRDHHTHDGSCVRATWVQVPPEGMDQGIEYYKTSVLPQLESLEGFCSASLMVDRGSGRAVSCATFDSLDAMQRNRDQATQLKTKSMAEAGAQELDECEFELAVAHLRVPELV